jgi:hypothetical protein
MKEEYKNYIEYTNENNHLTCSECAADVELCKCEEEAEKMIAEFMDGVIQVCPSCEETAKLDKANGIDNPENWKYLMPVIEKIEIVDNFRYSVDTKGIFCTIYDNQMGSEIAEGEEGSKYHSAYYAVVQFIKWYNENKKP